MAGLQPTEMVSHYYMHSSSFDQYHLVVCNWVNFLMCEQPEKSSCKWLSIPQLTTWSKLPGCILTDSRDSSANAARIPSVWQFLGKVQNHARRGDWGIFPQNIRASRVSSVATFAIFLEPEALLIVPYHILIIAIPMHGRTMQVLCLHLLPAGRLTSMALLVSISVAVVFCKCTPPVQWMWPFSTLYILIHVNRSTHVLWSDWTSCKEK